MEDDMTVDQYVEALRVQLNKLRPEFNIGIATDPLIYAILELIDEAADQAFQDGFETGFYEGRRNAG